MSMFFPLSGVLLLNSVLTVRAHQPTSHEGQAGDLHRCCGPVAQQESQWLGLSALGLLCSEERQSDRQSKLMETEL